MNNKAPWYSYERHPAVWLLLGVLALGLVLPLVALAGRLVVEHQHETVLTVLGVGAVVGLVLGFCRFICKNGTCFVCSFRNSAST